MHDWFSKKGIHDYPSSMHVVKRICLLLLNRTVCHHILARCKFTIHPPDGQATLYAWWRAVLAESSPCLRKGLSSIVPLVAWAIWKHCNAVIFDHRQPSIDDLLSVIQDDVSEWDPSHS